MTTKTKIITLSAIPVCAVLLLALGGGKDRVNRINWFNDGVYFTTNHVADVERNKALPPLSSFYYFKEQITTNKVSPFYFRVGDKDVELGAREDGTVVWREARDNDL